MVMYNLYVFNRRGTCLYSRDWPQKKRQGDDEEDDEEAVAEKRRLVFGMLHSITDCVMRMAATRPRDGALVIKTNAVTIHTFMTLSGFRFVTTTDNGAGDLRPNLVHIFANIWVEHVVKSPLYHPSQDEMVDSPEFDKRLAAYVEGLSCFR